MNDVVSIPEARRQAQASLERSRARRQRRRRRGCGPLLASLAAGLAFAAALVAGLQLGAGDRDATRPRAAVDVSGVPAIPATDPRWRAMHPTGLPAR